MNAFLPYNQGMEAREFLEVQKSLNAIPISIFKFYF